MAPGTHLGLAEIESMVGNKMAQKLLDSIGDILGGTSDSKKEVKSETTERPAVEDIVLPSGEKVSRIKVTEDDKDTTASADTGDIQSDGDSNVRKESSYNEENLKNDEPESASMDPRSDISDER